MCKKGYLKQLCKISNENNIAVIFDEIKCGLGRSGNIFAFLDHDCIPDIVTTSKALGGGKNAISAMISSRKLFNRAYGSLGKAHYIPQHFLDWVKLVQQLLKH